MKTPHTKPKPSNIQVDRAALARQIKLVSNLTKHLDADDYELAAGLLRLLEAIERQENTARLSFTPEEPINHQKGAGSCLTTL